MKRDESTYDFVADLYRNIDADHKAQTSAVDSSAPMSSAPLSSPPDDDELESLSQALQMFREDATRLPEPDESLSLAILKQEKLLRNSAGAAQPWWEKLFASMMHPAFGAATLVLILGSAGLYQLLKAPPMQSAMQEPANKVATRPIAKPQAMPDTGAMATASDGTLKQLQSAKHGQIEQRKNTDTVLQDQMGQALEKEAPQARPVATWTAGKKQKVSLQHKTERKTQAQKRAKAATDSSSVKIPASENKGSWGGFAPRQSETPKPKLAAETKDQRLQDKYAEQILEGSAGQLTDPSIMDMDRNQNDDGATGLALNNNDKKEDSLVADREAPAEEIASPKAEAAQEDSPVDDVSSTLSEQEDFGSAPAPAKKRRSRASAPAPANVLAKAKTKNKASAPPPQATAAQANGLQAERPTSAEPTSVSESLPGLRSRSGALRGGGAGKSTGAGRSNLDEMNRSRMQRQALDQFAAGMRAYKMHHYEEALGLFGRAEQMQARGQLGHKARIMRARSLFKLKRFHEASKLYEWAMRSQLKLNNRAQIIDELANCYKHMGQANKAKRLRQGERTPTAQ